MSYTSDPQSRRLLHATRAVQQDYDTVEDERAGLATLDSRRRPVCDTAPHLPVSYRDASQQNDRAEGI